MQMPPRMQLEDQLRSKLGQILERSGPPGNLANCQFLEHAVCRESIDSLQTAVYTLRDSFRNPY